MKTLALVMIVKNEEEKLGRCLASVGPYVNEMIIVDTGSSDQTIQIAEQYGARIYQYAWNNHFAEARNYALGQSSCAWNLVLDADEYLQDADWNAIAAFMETGRVGRIQVVSTARDGNEISSTRNWIPRLLPSHVRYSGRIHEQIDPHLERVNVPLSVNHDGYLDTDKSARNLPLLEQQVQEQPEDPYFNYQLAKEYKRADRLTEAYEALKHSLNSMTGNERYAPNALVDYIYIMMDMQLLDQAREIVLSPPDWVKFSTDYHFVTGIFYMNWIMTNPQQYLHELPRIAEAYQRCLEIGETDEFDAQSGTGSFAALYNLGVLYEVQGRRTEAIQYYEQAAEFGYAKAVNHLQKLKL